MFHIEFMFTYSLQIHSVYNYNVSTLICYEKGSLATKYYDKYNKWMVCSLIFSAADSLNKQPQRKSFKIKYIINIMFRLNIYGKSTKFEITHFATSLYIWKQTKLYIIQNLVILQDCTIYYKYFSCPYNHWPSH